MALWAYFTENKSSTYSVDNTPLFCLIRDAAMHEDGIFVDDIRDTGRPELAKLFWLIYGYAYDHHWLDGERYTADFLNKSTKLRMPKKNEIDEDLDIRIYTQEEIGRIAEVLKDTNIYVSFLIGYYCGLRVSECMGLMWKDFNEQDHTLRVGKQMLYNTEEHMFYLATTKTVAGKRTVYVPDILYNYLIEYKEQQRIDRQCRGYKATEARHGKAFEGRLNRYFK